MNTKLGVIAVFLFLFSLLAVAAQPQNVTGQEVLFGRNETRLDNGPATGHMFEGGNISEMNITTEHQTGWWQGVWGSIFLNFTLEDATGNVFYTWGIGNVTSGEVYFSNGSLVLWGANDLVNASAQNLTYAQTILGWANSTAPDNLTNTYSINTPGHTHQAFSITNGFTFGASSTPAVNMFTPNGLSYNATMLWQNATFGAGGRMDYPIFAALVDPTLTAFKGMVADFQVLLPARSDSGLETYFVYVELQ